MEEYENSLDLSEIDDTLNDADDPAQLLFPFAEDEEDDSGEDAYWTEDG